jgi:hypothetical protein
MARRAVLSGTIYAPNGKSPASTRIRAADHLDDIGSVNAGGKGMGGFDVKGHTLATATTGLLQTAIVILNELANDRGHGPWISDLHDTISRHLKNMTLEDLPPCEELEHIDAALLALDAVFSTVDPQYTVQRRGK